MSFFAPALNLSLDLPGEACYTEENAAIEDVSGHAEAKAGFGGDGLKGFDTVITNLQMRTYITVHSFEYARDKYGQPYGWGIAKYAVTEDVLGTDVTQGAYNRSPDESKARIVQHLKTLCPDACDGDLAKLIR